ncbi:immunoglobulin-like domain-containing protein [Phocaeicola sartorii]|uniref:immunoglobulin-like domain-containing protein n=1 Tax=Phocaeicola sartorii TaxID=671267 RepID=UPI003511F3C9
MKHLLLVSLTLLCSCHSTTSKKGQEYETDSIPQQEELCPDSISKIEPISLKEEQEKSPQAIAILQPVPRDIPTGEAINPDSLSMQTEYDYYPLATTEVKVIIANHSHFEYDCGESYSLAYYNSKQKSWETLPTNPIINSILWIFPSDCPTHEQTIKLYTSEVPNRAGKYRIYKSFNDDTKVAYAEFELVDEAGAKRLRKQMDAARHNKNIISSQNLYVSYMRGDSIFVDLINNSIHFQKLFRKEILNYSAINYGAVRTPSPFTQKAYADTLQISMKTEKPIYPIGTESVNVILTNRNLSQQSLFFGEYCFVARKQGEQWIPLHDNSLVNSVGILLEPDGDYRFKARLYPLFNDNTSGQYRVYKEVEFDGAKDKWYMAAEFRIE